MSEFEGESRTKSIVEPVFEDDYALTEEEEAILFAGFEPVPEGDEQERRETIAGIKQGIEDFEAGRFRPLRDVVAEFRAKHNFQ